MCPRGRRKMAIDRWLKWEEVFEVMHGVVTGRWARICVTSIVRYFY